MSKDGIDAEVNPGAGKSPPDPPVNKAGDKNLDTDGLVETWFKEFFPNSPVSRDTEAWNLLLRAKEVLKQRLKGA
jgi:hypothetical protein